MELRRLLQGGGHPHGLGVFDRGISIGSGTVVCHLLRGRRSEGAGRAAGRRNEKDLADIPDNVKRNLELVPVSTVEEVLEHALVSTLVPIEWDDEAEDVTRVASSPAEEDEERSGLVKH